VNNKKSNLFHSNSLELTKEQNYVDEVMDDWANLAVEGHFMPKTMVGLSRAFCCIVS
jgi:hypothetical protein